jgi:predicted branched-subunit amino acid permease
VVIDGGIGALNSAGVAIKQGGGTLISLERQVRIAAGSLVVIGVALGALVHPGFYGIAAFVGAGLVFAGVSDSCAMGMMLARMPWNNSSASK